MERDAEAGSRANGHMTSRWEGDEWEKKLKFILLETLQRKCFECFSFLKKVCHRRWGKKLG